MDNRENEEFYRLRAKKQSCEGIIIQGKGKRTFVDKKHCKRIVASIMIAGMLVGYAAEKTVTTLKNSYDTTIVQQQQSYDDRQHLYAQWMAANGEPTTEDEIIEARNWVETQIAIDDGKTR